MRENEAMSRAGFVAFLTFLVFPLCAGAMDGLPLGAEFNNTGGGITGWVRVPDHDAFEPQVFTVEAWIRPLGNGYGGTDDAWGAVIVAKPWELQSGSYLASFFLSWSPVDERVSAGVAHEFGLNWTSFHSIESVQVGTKAHVAMSFDGVWLKIFVNGQLDSEEMATAGNIDYGDHDVLIGAANWGGNYTRAFQGVVDDVRIWNYARSAGEISAQMACSLDGTEPGLLAYYSFNAGDCSDDSGNGHDGVEDGSVQCALFNDGCLPFVSGMEVGDLSDWTAVVP